jgi:hypothetical protein
VESQTRLFRNDWKMTGGQLADGTQLVSDWKPVK